MSSVDDSRREAWAKMQADSEQRYGLPLKSDGGDGTSGGMEARVARLESDMEHVKKGVERLGGGVYDVRKALGEIKVTLAAIDERTKSLPSKWEVFLILTGVLTAAGAIVGLTVRFLPA